MGPSIQHWNQALYGWRTLETSKVGVHDDDYEKYILFLSGLPISGHNAVLDIPQSHSHALERYPINATASLTHNSSTIHVHFHVQPRHKDQ